MVERYLFKSGRYIGTANGVRPLLDQIRKLGSMDLVIGFYTADEPDLHYSDSDVRAANQALRQLCAEFPQLGSCLLVVIYSDHFPVGLDSYDWVGQDRYGSGPQFPAIGPHQKLVLVPGGADPWRELPDASIAAAQSGLDVALVIPFLYLDYAGGYGIGNNGMRQKYCQAGRTLTQRPGAC